MLSLFHTLFSLSLSICENQDTAAKGAPPIKSGTHTRCCCSERGMREGGCEREREVSLCVCKNNLQYETRRNATRKVRRASASACTTDSAVTPAEAATAAAVAVIVAYGGRLLRFSFGQRKYKEIWKIRCVILYVCIVRFYEHTRAFFCFLFTFVSVFFLFVKMRLLHTILTTSVSPVYVFVCMYVARRPVCLLRRIFFSTFFAPPLRFVVLLLLVLRCCF